MAAKKLSLRYGAAAVVLALVIIGTTLYVNPMTTKAQTDFVVMLTDPPNVPEGTTKLEVTYSGIQLHVTYSDETSNWIAAEESGRVDLLSLVSVSQTIASISLPTGSTVDKLKFTISSAEATIAGEVYPVKVLSEQLIINLKKIKLDGATTGALIDLRPRLVEIEAVDSNGEGISYYVLVPSATAVVKMNLAEKHSKVGAKNNLSEEDNEELEEEFEKASKDVTINTATLYVKEDVTTLTVVLENTGTKAVSINGLMVHGDFSFEKPMVPVGEGSGNQHGQNDEDHHPRTIPFQVIGEELVPARAQLVPRMGDNDDHDDDKNGVVLGAKETITLTFSGVIQIHPDKHGKASPMTITPLEGSKYIIRVAGEGSQTLEVTAHIPPS